MKKELSKFQRGKIVLGLIEDLKNLPNKDTIFMNPYGEEKLMKKIAQRAGITFLDWSENGMVDITDDVSVTLDNRIDNAHKKLNGEPKHVFSSRMDHFDIEVDEKLKEAVIEFEKKNIPISGPCNTHLGEIFRAIQYIQYRAVNDGDLAWDPGSPSFMSNIYLRSKIDELNYSGFSFNGKTGEHSFEFTDPFLTRHSCNMISDVIEDQLAETANYIKYQIMDLLLNGKIEDSPNEFDSRDFKKLKKERYW